MVFSRYWLLGLLGLVAPPLAAQNRIVQGTVRDSLTGGPVVGAEIAVRGSTVRAVSSADGAVTIAVPTGAVTLTVRAIGYRRRDVALGSGDGSFAVAMARDIFKIEELVVTGQATGTSRENLANAIATVSGDDLNKHPTSSIEQQLAGRVAGAEISANSGAPGGGLQVRLRGITSVNATASPLYVVDGVIVSDAAIASNANAITAAAGGANPALTQDNQVNRIADLNPAEIESIEILKGASASAIYGGRASNGVVVIRTKKGATGAVRVNIAQRLGVSTTARMLGTRRFADAAEVDATFRSGTAAAFNFQPGVFYDNEKFLLDQRQLAAQTAIDVSGGTDNTRYFLSGNVENTPGIVRSTYFQRQSVRINLDQRIGTKVQASLTTNVLHTKGDRGLTNNDNTGTSYYIALSSTPSFIDLRQRADGSFPVNPFASSNPLQTAALFKNTEDVWRVITGSKLELQAHATEKSSLRLIASGGIDYFNQKNNIFSPPELQFEPGDGQPGTSLKSTSDNLNLNLDANVVHSYRGSGFSATTSFGAQFARRDLDIQRVEARTLNAGQSNIDAGTQVRAREFRSLINTLGFYGQEELLLLGDKLLLTAGLRADQNSTNANASKLFLYPKVAGSFRLSSSTGFLNALKLRAAYGQAGNEPAYGQRFTGLNPTLNAQGIPGLTVIGVIGNPDLHAERSQEIEVGLDGQMAASRLSFEASVYQKNITDLLLTRNLATSSGFLQEIFNGGELRTRGAEVALGVVPIQNRSTNWYLRTSFSLYRSVITSLPVPPFQTGGFGTSLGAWQIEQGKSATQIVGSVGGVDKVIGDVTPRFKMSFINDVSWKRFSFHGLLDYSQGGSALNLTELLYDAVGVSKDFVAAGANRIRTWGGGDASVYVESATYLKLREVSVSYDLPKGAVAWLGRARTGRLSFSGRNLLTSSPYKGLDPEVSNFGNQPIARGIDVAPYPQSRAFYFTVDIGF